MLPLHDDVPASLRPIVTLGLIAVCVAVFAYQATLDPREEMGFVFTFGLVPVGLLGGFDLPRPLPVPDVLTLATAIVLHGDWMHLLGNMLFLWVFGNNVEDAMGHGRFLLFFLVCGVLAGLLHAATQPLSPAPMIGASGAVSGVLGAYILLHPRARVLVWIGFLVLRLPAAVMLGLWFALQLGSALASANAPSASVDVAWWAHVGGFVAGAVLVLVFRQPGVRLFQPPVGTAPPPAPRPPAPFAGSGTPAASPRSSGSRLPRSAAVSPVPRTASPRGRPRPRSRIPPSGS